MIKEVAKLFKDEMELYCAASASIRIVNDEHKNYIGTILKYIEYFNSIGEFETRVLDRNLDEIVILNEFKDLIIPRSVRYNPSDLRTKDLIKRVNKPNGYSKLNYSEFILAQVNFRRLFKKDINSNVTTLATIKVNKSLNEVMPYVCKLSSSSNGGVKEYLVRYDSAPFIPLFINGSVLDVFEENYWNASIKDTIRNYVLGLNLKNQELDHEGYQ